MANPSNSILKSRLQQSNELDLKVQQRSFGAAAAGAEPEPEPESNVLKEEALVARVKDAINRSFGEQILDKEKVQSDEFKKLLFNTVLTAIQHDRDYQMERTKQVQLAQKIVDDVLGFGPIQDLLEDPLVTEIMVSRWNRVYVERGGRLVLDPDHTFASEEQLQNVIQKIVQPIGRVINNSEPLVDGRLPDKSRVNATIPPISPDGATLTIRKFSKKKLTGEDYLRFGSLSPEMLEFLARAVQARMNIIVSGGTGSGKTTLLNMLSNFIPAHESIVTVEDTMELQLLQDNVRRLESRPKNAEGKGEVTIRDLVKNTLRMRPDRIVVGEIRDGAVVDMFSAMSTGHDGSLTTIHANSPRDLMDARLPILFGMSDMKLSEDAQRHQIASSVDLVVQISRLRDGSRKITHITHVAGLGQDGASKLKLKKEADPNKIYLQHIFSFRQEGDSLDAQGRVQGQFEATGYAPKDILERMSAAGVSINQDIFKKPEREPLSGEEG